MAFGGALSFNGIDGVIAAGVAMVPETPEIPAIPALSFPAIEIDQLCDSGITVPTVSFAFELPPVKTSFNVRVNGNDITVEANTFAALTVTGEADLNLTNPACSPDGGFSVPIEATTSKVIINGASQAAIPGIEPIDVAPIVTAASMAMQTAQTNVLLYW